MLVIVIRRAGAFRRHHQRADRLVGSALLAEQLALRRLQHALQHLPALSGLRIGDSHARYGKAAFGVPLSVRLSNPESRLRDKAQSLPLKYGRNSNTSAMSLSAARFPSQGTARWYWFSTFF